MTKDADKEHWLERKSLAYNTKEGHVRYTRKESLSRERVLKDWYGGNKLGIQEIGARRDNTIELGSVFPDLIKSLGLEEESVFSIITEAWKDLVGNMLKTRIIPIEIKKNCLYIEAIDSSTLFHLQSSTLKNKLVENLTKLTGGKITQIRFVARGRAR